MNTLYKSLAFIDITTSQVSKYRLVKSTSASILMALNHIEKMGNILK